MLGIVSHIINCSFDLQNFRSHLLVLFNVTAFNEPYQVPIGLIRHYYAIYKVIQIENSITLAKRVFDKCTVMVYILMHEKEMYSSKRTTETPYKPCLRWSVMAKLPANFESRVGGQFQFLGRICNDLLYA